MKNQKEMIILFHSTPYVAGSLMYTKLHLNKYWRVFLEVFVVIHGGVVAAQTGGPSLNGTAMWQMFVFGFLLCFALTQVWICCWIIAD